MRATQEGRVLIAFHHPGFVRLAETEALRPARSFGEPVTSDRSLRVLGCLVEFRNLETVAVRVGLTSLAGDPPTCLVRWSQQTINNVHLIYGNI